MVAATPNLGLQELCLELCSLLLHHHFVAPIFSSTSTALGTRESRNDIKVVTQNNRKNILVPTSPPSLLDESEIPRRRLGPPAIMMIFQRQGPEQVAQSSYTIRGTVVGTKRDTSIHVLVRNAG